MDSPEWSASVKENRERRFGFAVHRSDFLYGADVEALMVPADLMPGLGDAQVTLPTGPLTILTIFSISKTLTCPLRI